MAVHFIAAVTIATSAPSVHGDEDHSSLLQFKQHVFDAEGDAVECFSGKCRPVTTTTTTTTCDETTTTTTTCDETTTPLFFVKKDTCDRFFKEKSCPKNMLPKPSQQDCGDGECTAKSCCAKQDTCAGHKCGKGYRSTSDGFCGKLKCVKSDCCEPEPEQVPVQLVRDEKQVVGDYTCGGKENAEKEAFSAYWEYHSCGHFSNDYNQGLCKGINTGDCPKFWDAKTGEKYIQFPKAAEDRYPGISKTVNCKRAQLVHQIKSKAFLENTVNDFQLCQRHYFPKV